MGPEAEDVPIKVMFHKYMVGLYFLDPFYLSAAT